MLQGRAQGTRVPDGAAYLALLAIPLVQDYARH